MTYKITLYNKFKRPYFFVEPSNDICISESFDSYETDSFKLCNTIVKDFLDAPLAEMTLDQIYKDFNYDKNLSEENAIRIKNYYNGRLALYRTIVADLHSLEDKDDVLMYNIPAEYNSFSVESDEFEKKSVQLEAYVKIEITK